MFIIPLNYTYLIESLCKYVLQVLCNIKLHDKENVIMQLALNKNKHISSPFFIIIVNLPRPKSNQNIWMFVTSSIR